MSTGYELSEAVREHFEAPAPTIANWIIEDECSNFSEANFMSLALAALDQAGVSVETQRRISQIALGDLVR